MQEDAITREKLAYLERQINNLSKLVDINRIINSTLDIKKLLTIVMETIKDIMFTEASTLLLYEEETGDLVFKVALSDVGDELMERYRVRIGQGIAGWVAENRKALYTNDPYNDPRFNPEFDQKTGFNTKAILCAPLFFKGKMLGVIQAVNPLDRPGFDDHDMGLFSVFADQAALAVQNAMFFQRAIEEERIRGEFQSAQMIQNSLIPNIDYDFNGVKVSARSIPVREVGGEFHGVYEFDGRYLGVALGDIHEKGLAGGLHASMISGALRSIVPLRGRVPSQVIRLMNMAAPADLQKNRTVSVFYGVIDLEEMTISYVNAGVAYPVVVRDGKARYLRFGSTSLVSNEIETRKVRFRFRSGDCFVIVTDGLLNVKNRNGKRLGLKRIMQALERGAQNTESLINDLIIYAEEFSEGLGAREDMSIIACMIP